MRGLGAADAIEVGLGRGGLAAHAPVHHGDLHEEAYLVAALERAAAELVLVEGGELVPLLGGGVRLGEEAQGVRLAGDDRQHLLVGGDGAVLIAELPRCGAPEAEAGGDAVVLLRGAVATLGQDERLDARHVLPVAGGGVRDLGEGGGAPVLGVDGEGLLDVLEGLGAGARAAVAVGDVGGAGVERALELALARGGLGEAAA